MAQLRAELKRAFLQSLYDAVQSGTASDDLISGDNAPVVVSLEDALKAFQKMGFAALKDGRLSIQSSGFAHSISFSAPQQWRAFSQEEVFAMAQEFREVYNDAKLRLIAAGNATPVDLELLQSMMADDRLQSVSSLQRDHTMLRWNARY